MKTSIKAALKIWLVVTCVLLSIGVASFSVSGCKLTPRAVTTNTIFSLQKTTVGAYDGYIGEVIAGRVKTNSVPLVSKKFNTFQAATLVALDAVEWNTNAIPPTSLTVLSTDLLNLIATLSKK